MKHLITAIMCAWAMALSAQDIKRPESYNFLRGLEAIRNDDAQGAFEYLSQEIEENPRNGYAHAWIAVIRKQQEEYGKAISSLDLAIKYIPRKDVTCYGWVYAKKAEIYRLLEEYDKALGCICEAIAIQPDEIPYYAERAYVFGHLGRYDEADKDYRKIIELDSGEIRGYLGLGYDAALREDYETAIRHFDYVVKLAGDYSDGYAYRAECFIALKRYGEAAADVVKALSIDGNERAYYAVQLLADSSLVHIVTKLKVQAAKSPMEELWPLYLGIAHERAKQYEKAAEYYKASYKLGAKPFAAHRIAKCYNEQGDYDEALRYINLAVQANSTNEDYILLRGVIHNDMGKVREAIADMDTYISLAPDQYFGYYRRGWYKDHGGDTEGAIEDYTTAITLNPEYAYSYLNRGVLYRLLGKDEQAKADFEEVIRRDTVPDEDNTAHYAYYYLGQKDKAIDFMDKALEKNEMGNYYDAACLYSVMGETDKALGYLRKAFETGFRRFAHVGRDRDLNNIRGTQEFKDLLREYLDKHAEEVGRNGDEPGGQDEATTEIPFTKDGNMCKVKCTINDLPLHFIFDTGASDVSISSVEATFMLKNDYLKPSDIVGKQQYLNANGDVTEGTVINLRRVDFGGLHLDNVKASVVKSQNAPLLLGQSVMNRLGKIEIDNAAKVVRVTYKR